MDITPTRMGAVVDVTDDLLDTVVDMLADAFAGNETAMAQLLVELADAQSALHNLKVSAEAGRPVSDERIETTACELGAVRDALVGMLSGRLTITLTSVGCRQYGGQLTEAGLAAERRFRTPGQVLPHQQDRRVA